MSNPRFPHTAVIKRVTDGGDPFSETDDTDIVIYNGECRSYMKHTTSEKGEVLTSTRVLAIPLKRGEWANAPQEGDRVEVVVGSVIEYGRVIDKLPNNFGTDVVWRYGRN